MRINYGQCCRRKCAVVIFFDVVFSFQPMELVSLHKNLKQDGISCGLGKLVDFLDEQVIVGTACIVACVRICYYWLFCRFVSNSKSVISYGMNIETEMLFI